MLKIVSNVDEELPKATAGIDPDQFCYRTAKEANIVLNEYIKEKTHLQNLLDEKEKEISKYKARIYELLSKVEHLEQKVHSKGEGKHKLVVPTRRLGIIRHDSNNSSTAVTSSTRHRRTRRTPRTSRRASKLSMTSASVKGTPPTPILEREIRSVSTESRGSSIATKSMQDLQEQEVQEERAVPVFAEDNNDADIEEMRNRVVYFEEVGQKFPDLKVSKLFEAEKWFRDCDLNGDGNIDENELEQSLVKQGSCTAAEVRQLMKEIDIDKSGFIDIMEYLAVTEKIQMRKPVAGVPKSLQQSTVCAIQ